jgi:pimeloyl-ACP methyl ester carboxylesterase
VKQFVFANGILNCPGSSRGWTDLAVQWVNARTEHRADRFEYFSPILCRRLFLNRWTRDFAEVLSAYAGQELVLVGHSNGCELICRALRISGVTVSHLHLISGACAADCYTNGLNAALRSGRVGEVTAYVAEKDLPMKIARVSQNLIGWLGLGYGTLGLNGPTKIDPAVQERVTVVREPNFGHSTWFEPQHFDDLMMTVTGVIAFENHSQDVSDDSKTGNSSEGDWSD